MTVGDLARAIQQAGDERHGSARFYFDCEDPKEAVLDMWIKLERVVEILNAEHARYGGQNGKTI